MVLKDKKKKKKPRPRRLTGKPSGRLMTPVFKTGMNRDIPMGGAGGSQNLLANLQASRQAQPSAQVIQTPDQFKLAQDIKAIRTEQADIAEEVAIQKKERKERSDKGTTGIRKVYEKKGLTKEQAEAAATEMLKTTSNLRRQHGADPREEEVAAAAGGAAKEAHTDAGNVVPAEAAGATLRIVPKAMGGKKAGKRETLPDVA
jgi:hypothetical protein